MDASTLEAYLHDHIPLSRMMDVRVVETTPDRVVLEAPLAPNANHRGTAFGGSVSTLATLAGWARVHTRLQDEGRAGNTVIQHGSMHYDAPVASCFRAVCDRVDDTRWDRFVRTLGRRGRARIRLDVRVTVDDVQVARFRGAYVTFTGD